MTTQTPKLRFPEFADSVNKPYKKHSFKDIFLFSTGKNIKQNEASPEFETPCVRYGELYHMYNEVITEVINKTNLDKSELLFSDGDEILLPSAGEDPLDIGSASALTVANVAIGRTINVLKPQKSGIYSQIYVAYYINQKLRKTISTLAKGVSISNVYNSDLKTLEIVLPQLPEQTKIANFLTSIDEKIQALKQKKTLLEQYKKGIMQQIFSQELRFKKDNGSDFDDWEEKSLGEVSAKISDGLHSTPNYDENGEYYFVNGNNLVNGKIQFNENTKKVNHEEYLKHKKDLNDKSILISINGTIGSLALFNGENIILGKSACYINVKKGTNELFIYYLLQSYKIINFFISELTGSTIKNLSLTTIKNCKFQLPSLPEQQKIATFLSAIDEKIEKISQQIATTEIYKKGLLQQIFC